MSTRRAWFMMAMLLVPVGAGAHTHKTDAFVAPFTSFVEQSTLLGIQGSFAFTLHGHLKKPALDAAGNEMVSHDPHPWSLLLDYGSHSIVDDDKEWTIMAGGRWSKKGSGQTHAPTGMFFVQLLAGYTQTTQADQRVSGMGIMPGIGWDFLLWDQHQAGLRFQADLVVPLSGGGDSYPRFSLGLVYHWPLKGTKP